MTIFDNRRQTSIQNHFFEYLNKVRNRVKVVTVVMVESYITIIKMIFLKTNIILDCFHIVQQLNRELNKVRFQIII